MVAQILAEPDPQTPQAAAEVVTAALRGHRERRKAERLASHKDKKQKKDKEQQPTLEEQAYRVRCDTRQTAEAFADSIARLIRHRLLVVPADQWNAETDRTLVLIGRALGRKLVISGPALQPPKPSEQTPAA